MPGHGRCASRWATPHSSSRCCCGLWQFYLLRAELPDGAGAGGAAPPSWPQRPHDPALRHGGPPCARERPRSVWASCRWPAPIRAGDRPLRRPSSTTLWRSSTGKTSGRACLTLCGHGPVVLGYPDQALRQIMRPLALAQELAHPYSLAFALVHAGHGPSVPPGGASGPRAGRGHSWRWQRSRGSRIG